MPEWELVARELVFPVWLRVFLRVLYVRVVLVTPHEALLPVAFVRHLTLEPARRVFPALVLSVKGQGEAPVARRTVVRPLARRFRLLVPVLRRRAFWLRGVVEQVVFSVRPVYRP